jgi:hypothetical protein
MQQQLRSHAEHVFIARAEQPSRTTRDQSLAIAMVRL